MERTSLIPCPGQWSANFFIFYKGPIGWRTNHWHLPLDFVLDFGPESWCWDIVTFVESFLHGLAKGTLTVDRIPDAYVWILISWFDIAAQQSLHCVPCSTHPLPCFLSLPPFSFSNLRNPETLSEQTQCLPLTWRIISSCLSVCSLNWNRHQDVLFPWSSFQSCF